MKIVKNLKTLLEKIKNDVHQFIQYIMNPGVLYQNRDSELALYTAYHFGTINSKLQKSRALLY